MTYSPSSDSGGAWQTIRKLPGRTPLRVKLITAVLALVAIALAVISIAGITVLRNYLLGQADGQLQFLAQQAGPTMQHYVFAGGTATGNGASITWIPTDGKAQQVVQPVRGVGSGATALPDPNIPSSASWLTAHAGQRVTVDAKSGDRKWLVEVYTRQVFNTPDGGSVTGTVILGVDVTSVYTTIGKLTSIDLIVSGIALAGLAVIGVAMVRSSLRPLVDIEQTAEGIAAGDLTQRVPERDPRTEVGRLGRSLNAMLAQIETAFRARADSEAAARTSEQRMRQFVADASHELRTPLTAIRGFAEYYRQRGGLDLTPNGPAPNGQPAGGNGTLPPADLDRIMRRVEQESARMGVLVEDMLLLARLDQQRPLDHRTVDLLTLAADAVHDARVVAPERSINLTVSSGAALLVLGDEVRLRQVIGNLMSNALVHTPDGTPIDVRLRSGSLDEGAPPAADPPLSAAVLEVADRGPGLTPLQAERAFERFYRADQARTAGGTGLGLAIVAALVAAHGGRVWVESPAAGGAVFRIALPLAPEAIGHDADLEHEEHEERGEHEEHEEREPRGDGEQRQPRGDGEQREGPLPGILDSAAEDR